MDALIHSDVGAAEAVDRLLRIADQEQRAVADAAGAVPSQEREEFGLHGSVS